MVSSRRRLVSFAFSTITAGSRTSIFKGASRKNLPISSSARGMWDERYASSDYIYGEAANDFLREVVPTLDLPKNAKCLMLAEGEGRNAVFMAQQGFDVVGVDSSSVGMEKAMKLAASKSVKIEYVVEDLDSFDMGSSQWDCIVGIYCHFNPTMRAKVLNAVPKALRPGGYFLLECYTPRQLEFKTGGPPVAEAMYTKEFLSEFLSDHLEINRNEELVRDVHEGLYHTGKGAVVQLVGRKPSK